MNVQQIMPIVEIATIPQVCETESLIIPADNQPIKLATFEKRRWPYILTLPISWLLTLYVMAKKGIYKLFGISGPSINTFWFDGLGSSNRKIKEGAASWKALDIIYNYRFGESLLNIVDDFWIGMMNAQAVRNRFKLVKQELRRAILKFSNYEEVRLISLACGSAQAVIELIAELKLKRIIVRVILIDIDQSALDHAKDLGRQHGVSDQIEMVKASVSQVIKVSRNFRPQIIEMLGLLDYIPQEKAIRLAAKIRESLDSNGVFLTGNIASNPERHFLDWVINWQMIYREPADLVEIANRAGFSDYRLIYEPLKIHGVVVAQKA